MKKLNIMRTCLTANPHAYFPSGKPGATAPHAAGSKIVVKENTADFHKPVMRRILLPAID